jgi:hypothetical protein
MPVLLRHSRHVYSCVPARSGHSSSAELIVIRDGIWMRAPPATPWDALAAALNWPADTPVWTANICSSFCTVNVIRAARAWHCGSIVLNHCLWRWSTGSWGMVPRRSAICWCCVKSSLGKRAAQTVVGGLEHQQPVCGLTHASCKCLTVPRG